MGAALGQLSKLLFLPQASNLVDHFNYLSQVSQAFSLEH